jgi:hypothetical protein
MWKVAHVAAAVTAGACVVLVPHLARAVGPVDIEGGGIIGGATNPSRGPNPFAVGIGARAGVGIKGVYLGLAITYYLGASGDCGGGAPTRGGGVSVLPPSFCNLGAGGAEVELQQQAVLYGVDLGYTVGFKGAKIFKLRPLVQLGDTEITRTGSVGAQDLTTGALAALRSENSFYVQPGLTAMLTVESFFLAADANLLIVPGVLDVDGVAGNAAGTGTLTTSTLTFASFAAHAQVGFRF